MKNTGTQDTWDAPWWYRVSPFILQTLMWPFGRLMLHIFVHLRVDGRKNLREALHMRTYRTHKKRGVLFVINHESELDPIVLLSGIVPFSRLSPMFYVSDERRRYNANNFRSKYIYTGWFFRAWGAYAVTRGVRDYAKSLRKHFAFLNRGWSVAIFPEGKINRSRLPDAEAHGGFGYLAERTDAVIVPITVTRTKTQPGKGFWSRTWRMTITYHPPRFYDEIIIQNFTATRFKEGASHIMGHIYAHVSIPATSTHATTAVRSSLRP